MNKKKLFSIRTIAFALILTMTLPLAACGSKPAETSSAAASSEAPSVQESSVAEAAPAKITPDTQKKLDEAKGTNPEVVSWISIPNTNIDYPVLQSLEDNYKYESKDLNGKKTALDASKMDKDVAKNLGGTKALVGAIYFDAKDNVSLTKTEASKNMIIYGHNWTNIVEPFRIGNQKDYDVMFAQLKSYTDESFAKTNPYIYLSTKGETQVYKVFSVVYFNAFCKNYITPNPSDDEYKKLLADSQARSLYKYNTEVSTGDNIISLITCSRKYPKNVTQGNGFNIQRFAVLARLLRQGETDKDPVTVTKNTGNLDPKWTMKSFSLS